MGTSRRLVLSVLAVAALAAAVAGLASVVPTVARDAAFTIERFERRDVLTPAGTLAVTETITVRFVEPRRGLFRDLPTTGPDGRPGGVTVTVEGVDAGSADRPHRWVREAIDDGVRVRIGDPDVTLPAGSVVVYRLRYRLDGLAVTDRADPDRVEVRVDVPGDAWPTDVAVLAHTMALPGPAVDLACVVGARGSLAPCAASPSADGRALSLELTGLAPGETATIAVGLPADTLLVAPPTQGLVRLGSRGALGPLAVDPALAALLLLAAMVLAIGTFEVLSARDRYRDEVTDPTVHDRAAPTAVLAPPLGGRPADVAGLLRRASTRDAVLATLIDLEQRGWVRSTTEGGGEDLTVTLERGEAPRRSGTWTDAADRAVVDTLLPTPVTFTGRYDPVVSERMGALERQLMRRAHGVFAARGLTHRGRGLVGAGATRAAAAAATVASLIALAALAGRVLPLGAGVRAAIGVGAVATWLGLRWLWRAALLPLTSEGRAVAAEAAGFARFLEGVEAERIDWAAGRPGIDHHHPALSLLPYAVALGMAPSWYERFGPTIAALVADDPALRTATGGGTWWTTPRALAAATAVQRATSTAPSSRSGGGAGSGGGGGGGGSW